MKTWEYFARVFGSYYTIFIAIVVNMSIFMTGVSMAWSSPILVKLDGTEDNPLGQPITLKESELIGSLIFLGAAIGPLFFIKSSDFLGRKKTLTLATIPCFIGYGILTFAHHVQLYYFARFLIGTSMGAVSNLAPSYLSEVVFSVKNRSSLMAILSPATHLGLLTSFVLGPYLSILSFHGFIFILTVLITILTAYGCPESPYCVVEAKGRDATMIILNKLDVENAEEELKEIEKDVAAKPKSSFVEIFTSKKNFRVFSITALLFIFQQLTGVNILLAYSQQIFMRTSFVLPSEQCSIIVGILQVISASTATLAVRIVPRKALLYLSMISGAIFNVILGLFYRYDDKLNMLNWIPLVITGLYIITYNSGLDCIPWLYLGEIYPLDIKSQGTAITSCLCWLVIYLLSYTYYAIPLSDMFFVYFVFSILGLLFIRFMLIETKGKTLREIQQELSK